MPLRSATWVGTEKASGSPPPSGSRRICVKGPRRRQSCTVPATGFSASPREGRSRRCNSTPSGGITQATRSPAAPAMRATSRRWPSQARRRPPPSLTSVPSKRFCRPTRRAMAALSGCVITLSGLPLCRVLPLCRMVMRSASMRASSRSCVTSSMGMLRSARRRASSCCSLRRVTWSTAEKGSSSSSTAGSRARARATATRCCWPPESAAGLRCSRPSRCTRASSSCARTRRPSAGRWPSAATTFSCAVRCGKRA